jgi:hypothetical protein
VCPVEGKAEIAICESDQWVTDFDSANFGLMKATHQKNQITGPPIKNSGNRKTVVMICKTIMTMPNFRTDLSPCRWEAEFGRVMISSSLQHFPQPCRLTAWGWSQPCEMTR